MLSSLRRVSGPDTEVIEIATAIDHCRIDADDDGTLLSGYIATAREDAEAFLGRSLLPAVYRWTVADVTAAQAPMLRFAPSPSPGTLLVPSITAPWPPRAPLEFPRAPVTAIGSVVIGGLGIDDVTLTTGDYDADLNTDPARILIKPSAATTRADRMVVTFTAGYANADAVPRPIRQAMLLMIAHMWEHRGDAEAEIPPAARRLMRPFRITAFG